MVPESCHSESLELALVTPPLLMADQGIQKSSPQAALAVAVDMSMVVATKGLISEFLVSLFFTIRIFHVGHAWRG